MLDGTFLMGRISRKKAAPMKEIDNLKALRGELVNLAGHYLREAILTENIDRRLMLTNLSVEALTEAAQIAYSINDMSKAYDL